MRDEFDFYGSMTAGETRYIDVELTDGGSDDPINLAAVATVLAAGTRNRYDPSATLFRKESPDEDVIFGDDPASGLVTVRLVPEDTAGIAYDGPAYLIVEVRVRMENGDTFTVATGLIEVTAPAAA